MVTADNNNVEPYSLEHWSVVLPDGCYCRPEEHDLANLHLQGIKVVKYVGETLPPGTYALKTRTSRIIGFVDGCFITRKGHKYALVGDPDPFFKMIFGSLNPAGRLSEIIQKKGLL